MEWYLKVVRDNYANFSGRARRKEYWMFILINMLISLALYALGFIGAGLKSNLLSSLGFGLYGLYCLAIIIPSIAAAVRRLQDTGKSGWLLLLGFVPLANIALIVFLAMEGNIGPNEYGEDPKENERF